MATARSSSGSPSGPTSGRDDGPVNATRPPAPSSAPSVPGIPVPHRSHSEHRRPSDFAKNLGPRLPAGKRGGPRQERPDHFGQQASGDAVGLLAGGGHGDV